MYMTVTLTIFNICVNIVNLHVGDLSSFDCTEEILNISNDYSSAQKKHGNYTPRRSTKCTMYYMYIYSEIVKDFEIILNHVTLLKIIREVTRDT